jgi:regulatory protein
MNDRSAPPAAPPTTAELRNVAFKYLARYAATEAGLRRVLTNRIEKWRSQQAEIDSDVASALHRSIEEVITGMVQAGVVNDQAFAEMKGQSLRREGRSSRSARAKLMMKGVPPGLANDVLPDDSDADLAAAVMTARRRRLGPFQDTRRNDPANGARALAALIRAGFSMAIAKRALVMPTEEAEALIEQARR